MKLFLWEPLILGVTILENLIINIQRINCDAT